MPLFFFVLASFFICQELFVNVIFTKCRMNYFAFSFIVSKVCRWVSCFFFLFFHALLRWGEGLAAFCPRFPRRLPSPGGHLQSAGHLCHRQSWSEAGGKSSEHVTSSGLCSSIILHTLKSKKKNLSIPIRRNGPAVKVISGDINLRHHTKLPLWKQFHSPCNGRSAVMSWLHKSTLRGLVVWLST